MFCLSDHKKIIMVNTAIVCMMCEQKCVNEGAQVLLDAQPQRPLKSEPPFQMDEYYFSPRSLLESVVSSWMTLLHL